MSITLAQIADIHNQCVLNGFSSADDADFVAAAYSYLSKHGNVEALVNLATLYLGRDQYNAERVVGMLYPVIRDHPDNLLGAAILSAALTWANQYHKSALILNDLLDRFVAVDNSLVSCSQNVVDDFSAVQSVKADLVPVYNTQYQKYKDPSFSKLHRGSEDYWNFGQAFDADVAISKEVSSTLMFHVKFTGRPLVVDLTDLMIEQGREYVRHSYHTLLKDLPSEYVIDAPPVLGDIGLTIGGHRVNWAVLKDQDHVVELYNHGILEYIKQLGKTACLLEIGGGYGGLCLPLKDILEPKRVTLVDLPSTLGFAASYFRAANSGKRDFAPIFNGTNYHVLTDAAVVLVPSFLSESIQNKADLVLNTGSFGEMTLEQFEYYIRFIDRVLSDVGVVYEANDPTAHGRFDLRPLISVLFRGTVIDISPSERIWCRPGVESALATFSAGRQKSQFGRLNYRQGFPFPLFR